MKFVNTKLTPKQRDEFSKQAIKNPYGSFSDATKGIKPVYLTIDQKSNTWLAWCYDYHDIDENIKEFVFYYHNLPVFVQAILVSNENHVLWKITRIDTNDKILIEEQLKNAMIEAFQAYNISGWKDEESKQVKVIFNIGQ